MLPKNSEKAYSDIPDINNINNHFKTMNLTKDIRRDSTVVRYKDRYRICQRLEKTFKTRVSHITGCSENYYQCGACRRQIDNHFTSARGLTV